MVRTEHLSGLNDICHRRAQLHSWSKSPCRRVACIWGSHQQTTSQWSWWSADIIDLEYEHQWLQILFPEELPIFQGLPPNSPRQELPSAPILSAIEWSTRACSSWSHSTNFFQWVVGGRHKSVEGFGKVECQETKLITVIQTSCQVLYCVDELGLAAMQCPKAVLEMHQDLVYVHMVHYASEHNVLEHFAAHTCDRAQRDIQISPHHCVGNRW